MLTAVTPSDRHVATHDGPPLVLPASIRPVHRRPDRRSSVNTRCVTIDVVTSGDEGGRVIPRVAGKNSSQ